MTNIVAYVFAKWGVNVVPEDVVPLSVLTFSVKQG